MCDFAMAVMCSNVVVCLKNDGRSRATEPRAVAFEEGLGRSLPGAFCRVKMLGFNGLFLKNG